MNNISLPYSVLIQFAESLGNNGCEHGVKYQLSPDKENWYYWDGSSWSKTTETSTDFATSASDINSNLSEFQSGSIYVKAFLNSDGYKPCEVDRLIFAGLNY
jgi:hypothetical protein